MLFKLNYIKRHRVSVLSGEQGSEAVQNLACNGQMFKGYRSKSNMPHTGHLKLNVYSPFYNNNRGKWRQQIKSLNNIIKSYLDRTEKKTIYKVVYTFFVHQNLKKVLEKYKKNICSFILY